MSRNYGIVVVTEAGKYKGVLPEKTHRLNYDSKTYQLAVIL